MSDVYDRSIADTSMVSAALLFILVGIGLHMDYSSSGREYDQTVDETVENYVSRSRAAMALHATEEDVCASPSLELRAIQYHVCTTSLILSCGSGSNLETVPFHVYPRGCFVAWAGNSKENRCYGHISITRQECEYRRLLVSDMAHWCHLCRETFVSTRLQRSIMKDLF